MARHHPHEPIIGTWYDSKNVAASFQVVDDDEDYVEIQYLDGELDKIDHETWEALDPDEIPEPEDATAPFGVEHDQDIVKLLKEIEDQEDLGEYFHNIDRDEEEWE